MVQVNARQYLTDNVKQTLIQNKSNVNIGWMIDKKMELIDYGCIFERITMLELDCNIKILNRFQILDDNPKVLLSLQNETFLSVEEFIKNSTNIHEII